MQVITSNIKCNPKMSQFKVIHDVLEVSRLTGEAGVVMWQEIEIPRYKEAVKHLAPGDTRGLEVECPITVRLPRNWTVLGSEYRLMHKGRRLTTPDRYTTVVRTRRHDGTLVAFMNTHYVSGAWNGKLKTFKKWRQEKWTEHWQKQGEWIHELLAQGYTVIGGGDFNRVTLPKFHPAQINLTHSGIDHLFLIPADGHTVTRHGITEYHHKGLNTDHPAVVANVSVHKKASVRS